MGVVTALETARVFVEENISHRLPIDIVVFAEEGNVYWEYTQSGLTRLWCTIP